MARLPQPGGDTGNWGEILNEYLSQALKSDGTIKNNAVTAGALAPNAVTSAAIAPNTVNATSIADGSISESLLDTGVQSKLNAAAAGTTPDATTTVKGIVQLAGDLAGTAASPTVAKVKGVAISGTAANGTVLTASSATAAAWAAPAVSSVAGKTGVVTLAKGDVGLGSVDNTTDAAKPVSTATQSALDAKAPLASPTLTGTPAAPTATAGTSTTQLATTAFVANAVSTGMTPDATSSIKGKIQLAGDLTGTSASPALAAIITAGSAGSATSVPAITYDAKGRITAATPTAIQLTQTQVTNLSTDLAAKAVDTATVHKTGDETIAGIKSFTSAPKLTASSTSGHVWTATGTDGSGAWTAASGGASTSSTTLGSLYQPMTDIISSSVLTTDEYVTTLPSDYTNAWGTVWTSPNFNTQGQNWVAVNSGNIAAGCQNDSNGRRSGSNPFGSVFDFEFLFTGSKLDINIQSFGVFDTQVYIEDEGRMKKAKALPLAGNINGFAFRSLRFAEVATRRIRVVLPAVYFVQVAHEQSAIVRRSADRPLLLTTGDSYFDASSAYNEGSTRTFATFGIIDQIIESTGFAVARLGQGGSGYFNNGAGAASETPGPVNTTRFFSSNRVTTMSQFLGSTAKPVALLINGTINDGGLSGDGTNASASGMQARCLAGWQAVNTIDSLCSIIQIGPEPINDSHTVASVHATNRTGQMNAIAAHPQAIGFIDAGNPTTAFWNGTGYDNSPTSSQQAYMVGHDQIHPNWYGHKHYGIQIAAAMKTMKVPTARAQRTQ